MCVRGCVCVCGLDRTGKAALSAQAVICALKDTFSPVFTPGDSRQNRSSPSPSTATRTDIAGGLANTCAHLQLRAVLAASAGNNHELC